MRTSNSSRRSAGSSFPCFFMSRIFLPTVLVGYVLSRIHSFWKPAITPLPSRLHEPGGPFFDPLTATVFELQELLSSKKISSVDLVNRYITQIQQHDGYLRAVLCIAPTAIDEARRFDRERLDGRVRGPLHGIPILIKDNIATHPDLGMNTSAGSYALVSSRPRENADIINRLLAAGAIILGKSHLSELSGYKGNDLPPGWSALGGQTQSAYTNGDVDRSDLSFGHSSPGGSSTGSAVGVSAGFAPLAVGTDTIGSIITPSTRAALYGMRTTSGLINSKGVVPISRRFDVLGPLAKHPRDVAIFLDAVVDPFNTRIPKGGYLAALSGSWDTLRIGVLDPEEWFIPDSLARPNPGARKQMIREIREAYSKIDQKAKRFSKVSLISWEEVMPKDGFGLYDLLEADFRTDFELYLEDLENTQVRSVSDMVQYNYEHAELALPKGYESQDILINALEDHMTSAQYAKTLARIRHISQNQGIDLTLEKNDIDVIIGPADSAFSMLATSAGYPTATLPLSYLDFNGRPFGLFAMAKAHQEDLLLKVMSCWEETFPKRKPPVLPIARTSRL